MNYLNEWGGMMHDYIWFICMIIYGLYKHIQYDDQKRTVEKLI